MLWKVSAVLVIGYMTMGNTGAVLAVAPHERVAMPHESAAPQPGPVVAPKRIPQSRLIKPRKLLSTPAPSTAKQPVSSQRQPAVNSVAQLEPKSRLIRGKPVVPKNVSRFDKPLDNPQAEELPPAQAPTAPVRPAQPPTTQLPAEPLPSEPLPANALPSDDLPPNSLPGDDLPLESPSEPATAPEVNPLDEPLPDTAEPLDLDRPAPPQPSAPPAAPEAQASEELPTPSGTIYRLEPPSKLVPVAADELKPGVIYRHDDPRLGRPVWSFVRANGEFWHAFGPGTTQPLVHFDLRMTDEQALETLRKIDPKLAFNVTNQGARVFLRLQTDNSWKLVRTNSVPSIFDAETGQRWEMQWGQYLPVTHNHGDTWVYRDGQYWAPHWRMTMRRR